LLRSCQDSTGGRSYSGFPATARGYSQPDTAAGSTNCTEQIASFDGTNYNAGPASAPGATWHGISASEASCPASSIGVGVLCPDSTLHAWKAGSNGSAPAKVVLADADINNSDQVVAVNGAAVP